MTNDLNSKNNLMLIIMIFVVTLATFTRFWGIWWGLPFSYHPDEARIYSGIWQIFWELPVVESDYGVLPMKVVSLVWKLVALIDDSFSQKLATGSNFAFSMLLARFTAGLFGCGVVLLTLHGTARHFGIVTALIAAFILSVSPLLMQLSHFITVDVFLCFFLVGCFFSLLDYIVRPHLFNLLVIGLWIGAAISTKASSLPIILPAIAAIFYSHYRFASKLKMMRILTSILVLGFIAIGVFWSLHPASSDPMKYFLLDRSNPYFWHAWNFPQGSHKLEWNLLMGQGAVLPLWAKASSDLSFGTILVNIGWAIGYLPLLGIIFMARDFWIVSSKKIVIFTGLTILTIFALGFPPIQSKVFFTRYAAPVLPFIGIFLAIGWKTAFTKGGGVFKSFGLLVSFISLIQIFGSLSIYSQTDSRILVGQWISENIPHGTSICIENENFSSPVYNIRNFQTQVLPIYKWDVFLRRQFDLKKISKYRKSDQLEEYVNLAGPSAIADELSSILQPCRYVIISDRIFDNVAQLDDLSKLRQTLISNILESPNLQLVKKIEVAPIFFGLPLPELTLEHTTRIFDRPSFMILRRKNG